MYDTYHNFSAYYVLLLNTILSFCIGVYNFVKEVFEYGFSIV